MNKKLLGNALAGTSSILLSLAMIGSIGYSIADKWRSSVDDALGTTSWITKTDDPKYVSDYKTGKELMDAAKALSVREGAEGTVIMKNNDNVFPLQKNKKVALFGAASYHSYYSKAGNTDTVDLPSALKKAGFNINEDLEDIYLNHILAEYTETSGGWGGPKKTYVWDPNFSAGDYTTFKVNELAPSRFTEEGLLKNPIAADWEDKAKSDIAIVTFARPGGEGTTYKPGSALDTNGNPTGKNPLALSDDELAVVDTAKRLCGKVVVLLNTSCTIEVGPLVKGEHAVDGIAYIGIPNDYQFTGIVQALDGTVNPTGALADTYAFDSTSSPAMMNFGGDYYSDYTLVNEGYDDPRWPGAEIGNNVTGSLGGSASYSGGYYIVEAEGIYTGYNYYETRYYDSIANPTYKANSSKGVTQGESGWKYEDEVAYPFGYGLSYIDYEQKITNITVEDKANGNITATIAVTNKGDKDGKFLASLYVQTPYTDYDRQYKVEKSAIQFLSSEKVDVKAGQTENIQITVPTKYMASYDYTHAKTYIMDGGTYYFTTGNGSHDAVNNVLKAQKKLEGEAPMVCNILGREITKGTREMGIISGPKHIGFNDQEHDRSGICVYMHEQKMRETDLRGFQGAVEEGEALGLMVAFNRLGAINASHHVGFLQDIVRHEWNFQGLISTDMMNNKYYFNPESAIMASVTQMADFAGNNSNINLGKDKVHDATWGYLSIDATKNDPALVDAAREAMKYQLYAFANSAVLNISTERVVPYWETAIKAIEYTTLGLGCVTLGGYFGVAVLSFKKKEI